jgi:nitric oxide dioxygenase
LSPEALSVVRATAPVVAEHADQITAHFYPRMFAAHPELLRVFNQGNQATGEQSKALAGSVVAYAVQLIDPDAPSFDHVMRRIAFKHVSLGIRPEQYTIVGQHLLASVGEVLGDAVTPEVAAAWGEVHWLFAVQLVAEETQIYQQPNGDPDHRQTLPRGAPHRGSRRRHRPGPQPTDGGRCRPARLANTSRCSSTARRRRHPRQSTVSSTAVRTPLQITVRRVRGANGAPDGRVSSHLHDHVEIGDVLDVSAPAGDFVLTPTESPILLASAGAGITTVLPIVEHIARTQPQRTVIVAHADQSAQDHALRETVLHLGREIDDFTSYAWYETVDDGDTRSRQGFMDLTDIPLPDDIQVFTCGPLPFMRHVRSTLLSRGVPAARIRYEVFGPDLWAAQTSPDSGT